MGPHEEAYPRKLTIGQYFCYLPVQFIKQSKQTWLFSRKKKEKS